MKLVQDPVVHKTAQRRNNSIFCDIFLALPVLLILFITSETIKFEKSWFKIDWLCRSLVRFQQRKKWSGFEAKNLDEKRKRE